eukprot:CAMPEP_0114609758 /NCGR_PEP_ID=MMETSP0168-20121206/3251_1 /TAXON_ID=95228 ORGANISM="Vannella sp., Strain DIVA3 517/6/12" /NCGR_SAMPLE_ID=MMETSP0168 /ASSEMBLY_ACC=CAM_ASM_000044 /LENGTH=525 /DNA_ID=CAMNT_0001820681 /DNA_START=1 /DNA_END=1578 /DNA_ORIENTATION=+
MRPCRVCMAQARRLHAAVAQSEVRDWSDAAVQRSFLEHVADEKGVNCPKDWRNVSAKDVAQLGGRPLLRRYNNSLFAALQATFPEQDLEPFLCRPQVPKGFWDDAANKRRFMDYVAKQHSVASQADWKRVSTRDIARLGGARLLRGHGNVVELLKAAYPEQEWEELQCRPQASDAYWSSRHNCRAFLQRVAAAHGIRAPEDWRKVSRRMVADIGGKALFHHYPTLLDALRAAFPEQVFEERACRQAVSRGYWESSANRRAFLETIAAEHGVKTAEDWKSVEHEDIANAGGKSLLQRYKNSVFALLQDNFPELQLTDARQCRKHMPNQYWATRANRLAFMEEVREKHRIEKGRLEDWSRVTTMDLADMGGAGLLRSFGTMNALLRDSYPELWQGPAAQPRAASGSAASADQEWVAVFRCRPTVPGTFWESDSNVRQFVLYAQEQLGIRHQEDWYRISQSQLSALGGSGLLRRMPLDTALRKTFPASSWRAEYLLSRSKRSAQWNLGKRLQEVFGEVAPQPAAHAAA